MISFINITIFSLWLISALIDYLDLTYIWQLKEYRWDRFKDFLSTKQGKIYMSSYSVFSRSLIAIAFFFWPINEIIFIKYIILAFFIVDILYGIYKKMSGKFRRPDITKKAVLIILFALLTEGSLFMFKHDWTALLILLVFRFFILMGIIYLINIPTKLVKKYTIESARKKLAQSKKLTVIGITGSYAKTTTKNFLDHMLSKKFKVISTPKHVNTDYAIAKLILKTDFSEKDIFIVEMGAYRRGDLKEHCYLAQPKIGILTAINEQHLSIFGSIKNIQDAKYDLLRSLPEDGLAVVNSDNKYCREYLDELDCNVVTYGTDTEHNPTILVKDINKGLEGGTCTVVYKGKETTVNTKLRGAHNTINAMPCVLICKHLGMSDAEIVEAVKDLPQTIHIYKYGNCHIIDDSYNSNPDGFKVALDYMNNFKHERRRIVFTRGMLELGERAEEIHEQMAGEIAYTTDELVIIKPDYEDSFRRGSVGLKYRLDIKTIFESKKLLSYLKDMKQTNAVVLLENRIPSIVMEEILQNSTEI